MNKEKIIKELSTRLNLSEDVCKKIENVLEKTVLSGDTDKNSIVDKIMDKLNIDKEQANKIYNTAMDILKSGAADKVKDALKSFLK